MSKYKTEIMVILGCIILCLITVAFIKIQYFKEKNVMESTENVISYYNKIAQDPLFIVEDSYENIAIKLNNSSTEDTTSQVPYEIAPTFEDDGSIIYDGLTLTELTDKLNKSLNSYMKNTGYFFAKYTKDTGLDPYLSLAIVLLETGCKWSCSSLTVKCNNIGGLKGGESCNGGSYRRYETLEEGIEGYLNIIYNNYYLNGMTTAETMASRYAASSKWAEKVNNYIEEIKSK